MENSNNVMPYFMDSNIIKTQKDEVKLENNNNSQWTNFLMNSPQKNELFDNGSWLFPGTHYM